MTPRVQERPDAASEATARRLEEALAGLSVEVWTHPDAMPAVTATPEVLAEVLTRLKERAGFESVTFVTAVDRLNPAESTPGGAGAEPRFEVVHQLHSLAHCDRVRVRTPVSSDAPRVPTCTGLWPGARFMERECFDMFGIEFEGSPDPRRLLMPEEYGHHPLRKDFLHQGIEPDRLYREWDRERRKDWKPGGEDAP